MKKDSRLKNFYSNIKAWKLMKQKTKIQPRGINRGKWIL